MTKFILPSILIGSVFTLLVSLGFWQLGKANDKQRIVDTIAVATTADASEVYSQSELPQKEHYKVRVVGRYLDQFFIYDNQTLNGRYGYYIISPFILSATNEVVLVNRGFKMWNQARTLPPIHTNTQNTTVVATVRKIQQRPTLTSQNHTLSQRVLQSLDIHFLEQVLQTSLSEYILLLDKSAPQGYIRDWKPFYGSVARHQSYAFQWFTMAFVLMIIAITLVINLIKRKLNEYNSHN